jgi:hydrogenase/urease accessory protein HupE
MTSKTNYFRLTLFIVGLCLPVAASAHSPIKGMGDFFNGMIHPLLVPAQVLIILALGLLFGQHQPNQHKTTILLFLGATSAGLITSNFISHVEIATLLLVGAASIGLLVAGGLKIPWAVFIPIGIVVGFILGIDSTPEQLSHKAKITSLFGSGVGIYFLLLYIMAISESLSIKHWQTVAVRIVASWVSASALMVLALTLSHKL